MEIQLNNISKKYGNKMIFENLNLSIEKKEMVAIVGKSGQGKTTLLNMIGLVEKPDKGDIIIQGIKNPFNSEKQKIKLFRNTIGYLFQNYALIENKTVSKNLDIALEYIKTSDKKQKKEDAIERVGLKDKINNKVFELSGGEQQRVAIARLLLKKNDIILADEPTGALDKMNRDNILELLEELNDKGKTIIIVTHDDYVANKCKRKIIL